MAIPGRTDTARAANRSSPPNELVGGHVFAEHDRPIEFKFAIRTVILLIHLSPNGAQTADLCVTSCRTVRHVAVARGFSKMNEGLTLGLTFSLSLFNRKRSAIPNQSGTD